MTDIFAKKPLPASRAPSLLYPTFLDAFEALVEQHQREIREAEANQGLYLTTVEALRMAKLPSTAIANPQKAVRLMTSGVTVDLHAYSTDTIEPFQTLANELGLRAARLGNPHGAKAKAPTWCDCSASFTWSWVLPAKDPKRPYDYAVLRMIVNVDRERGMADVEVYPEDRTYRATYYLQRPRKIGAGTLQVVGRAASLVRGISNGAQS